MVNSRFRALAITFVMLGTVAVAWMVLTMRPEPIGDLLPHADPEADLVLHLVHATEIARWATIGMEPASADGPAWRELLASLSDGALDATRLAEGVHSFGADLEGEYLISMRHAASRLESIALPNRAEGPATPCPIVSIEILWRPARTRSRLLGCLALDDALFLRHLRDRLPPAWGASWQDGLVEIANPRAALGLALSDTPPALWIGRARDLLVLTTSRDRMTALQTALASAPGVRHSDARSPRLHLRSRATCNRQIRNRLENILGPEFTAATQTLIPIDPTQRVDAEIRWEDSGELEVVIECGAAGPRTTGPHHAPYAGVALSESLNAADTLDRRAAWETRAKTRLAAQIEGLLSTSWQPYGPEDRQKLLESRLADWRQAYAAGEGDRMARRGLVLRTIPAQWRIRVEPMPEGRLKIGLGRASGPFVTEGRETQR